MSSITKIHKISIFTMFIAAALIGSAMAFGVNYANAGAKKRNLTMQNSQLSKDKQTSRMHSAYLVNSH